MIFDESNHIERITIHATDDDDHPELWTSDLPVTITPTSLPTSQSDWPDVADLDILANNVIPTTEGVEDNDDQGEKAEVEEVIEIEPKEVEEK